MTIRGCGPFGISYFQSNGPKRSDMTPKEEVQQLFNELEAIHSRHDTATGYFISILVISIVVALIVQMLRVIF